MSIMGFNRTAMTRRNVFFVAEAAVRPCAVKLPRQPPLFTANGRAVYLY